MSLRKKNKKRKFKEGLTILEIIVVIGIVSFLTILTVANFREYERRNALDNLAQDVALSIRLAQSYGLNVRGAGGADGFQMSYGINFDESTPTEYFVYRNPNRGPDYEYAGGGTPIVERFSLGSGYSISNVCLTNASGDDCWGNGSRVIDIAFDRPKPDAYFFYDGAADSYGIATITIQDLNGVTTDIVVRTTGYISVE